MAAPIDVPSHEPPSPLDKGWRASLWKKFTSKAHTPTSSTTNAQEPDLTREASPSSGLIRRVSRKVVPGLPRAKTFKRQQSEVREKLEELKPTPAERRAVSVDRRLHPRRNVSHTGQPLPRASAPDFFDDSHSSVGPQTVISDNMSAPQSPVDEKQFLSLDDLSTPNVERVQEDPFNQVPTYTEPFSTAADVQSITTSHYDAMIHDELEHRWILNLSMHFRDKSRREKFFVTYREKEFMWRRVTISLDYRDAPEDSLEKDLLHIKFQREKSAKIYEAIRESLQDIQFYETVTNLKLQTTDGRLHVHVVEDVNEIIHYPTVRMVQHLRCRRVRERDLEFDSHMSGFVYKVRVDGQTLIKKEIPGPDTVDEFLYEVNALNSLRFSRNIIEFFGVVVDDDDQFVKGLLISYADQGALIDKIYDSQEYGEHLPWSTRERWARQIVQGLSDIHEAGFVQGDFTLSNIVIDDYHNAKIIDINRRGCPVGWEPPEATPLIDSNQRISMYIGVKSDLYQLGMVLWALATLEDEPEAHRRPLRLDPEIEVPPWYRRMVENCLHENPRVRLQATALLAKFPESSYDDRPELQQLPSISVDDGYSLQEYLVDGREGRPQIRTVEPRWSHADVGDTQATSPGLSDEPCYYPPRGRSPPSPLPSSHGICDTPFLEREVIWSESHVVPSTSGVGMDEARVETPRENAADAIAKQMAHDLKKFDADPQADLEQDQALTTGGESQTNEASLANDVDQVPPARIDRVEKQLSSSGNGSQLATTFREPPTTEILGETPSVDVLGQAGSAPMENQMGITAPTGTQNQGDIEIAAQAGEASHALEDGDSDSSPNYTHQRREDLPPELTGVGSAYTKQEEYRQSMCSDEDLGLNSTTATQNVTSQA
ncbi:Uu.00g018900.m01.CDS01 [Anthostomella pinea]|uniref:Uu.00g018900.m01.CDS01 n=1 Tax=Anthostomella pinea TaxID=933095 RepID=A0AAI8VZ79_9PEZI|nr:Uu.00g018900.m01.CDS01 [Anthostomella pinea]